MTIKLKVKKSRKTLSIIPIGLKGMIFIRGYVNNMSVLFVGLNDDFVM